MSTVTNADVERAPDQSGAPSGVPLLEVRDLTKYFPVKSGGVVRRTVAHVQAVDGISFSLGKGESLGLVGESGCGKTTTGRLITRLYDPTSGAINFEGTDISALTRRQMMPIRSEIQMIFQDPYSSLNPRHTVGAIVGTPLRVHNMVPEKKVLPRVQELLEVVGLNPEHYNRYPSEFSGGQRQRIGIARALALQPKLLVADEPVSALDVSIQAQVVNLLKDVQEEFGIAFLFIAHDLAVVRHFCPDVAVMYLGKIVEIGDRETIYEHPHHPYTQALLSAAPDVKQAAVGGRRERIRLEGDVPSPINPPSGCRFRTRCWMAQEICAKQEPPLHADRQEAQGRLSLRRRVRRAARPTGDRRSTRGRRPGQPRRQCRSPPEPARRARLRRHLVRPQHQVGHHPELTGCRPPGSTGQRLRCLTCPTRSCSRPTPCGRSFR